MIPPHQSFTEFLMRLAHRISADDLTGLAGQVAYSLLFALFPFLLLLLSLVPYLPVPDLPDRLLGILRGLLPKDAFSLVAENVRKLASEREGGILSFGLLIALWSSTGAITSLIDTLNRAYGVPEKRPFLEVQGLAVLMVIGLSLFILAALALLILGPRLRRIAERLSMSKITATVVVVFRWPAIVLLSFIPT